MATKSTRNLSYEQAQAMWPGVSFSEGEMITFTAEPIVEALRRNPFVLVPPGTGMIYNTKEDVISKESYDSYGNMKVEAVKADSGKPDWSLVPFEALEGMVRVLEFGANKYQAYNFAKGKGLEYNRLISATIRHLSAFSRGEDIDPESGLSHIYHCQCNLLFLAYFIAHKEKYTENDSRHKI